MVVSSTVLFLAYCRHKSFPPPTQLSQNQNSQQPQKQIIRSCLHSEEKKRERKKKMRKKVQFAENVKEPSGNGKEYRKEHMELNEVERSCRNKIPTSSGMPENRIALYNGILKDRVHRMQCSW
uniref:Uncharacterized protein n=1 Tax=Fagus sylvatica TaxID=28930 RepID=A0A2N9GMI1_FAGSY